jgi:Fe-S-cluster containining protein
MKWEVEPADITSEVCSKCIKKGPPHCCEILLGTGHDPLFWGLLKITTEGIDDLRITPSGEIKIICQHLDQERGRCNIYNDPRKPQICGDFNCVTWAKVDSSRGSPPESLELYNKIKNMFREEKQQVEGKQQVEERKALRKSRKKKKLTLAALDKEIIGAPYPKKVIAWEKK